MEKRLDGGLYIELGEVLWSKCGVRREEAYMRCNPADTYTKMI